MRPQLGIRSLTACLLFLLASIAAAQSASDEATTHARSKVSLEEFEGLVEKLSNWNRWGPDDQLGTLNLLTDRCRRDAVKLVRTGKSVSLSQRLISAETPRDADSFTHSMLSIGLGESGMWSMDRYSIAYHGGRYTHLDALCHLFYRDRMYNGYSRDEVTREGAKKLNILAASSGILGRGLLIDVPRLRGIRFLQPGDAITTTDFELWESETGLEIRPGDVVLLRTGKWNPDFPQGQGLAGLHTRSVAWLKERDISVFGSDAAADVFPSPVDQVGFPVHTLLLHAMGTPILDNLNLEELSQHTHENKCWEFMLTVAPLPVVGGTGSPVNPIATF